MTFNCVNCSKTFDDKGIKQEYMSPVYGPCFKYIAHCPDCKSECNEHRTASPQKKNSTSPSAHQCGGCCCHN